MVGPRMGAVTQKTKHVLEGWESGLTLGSTRAGRQGLET